MDFLRWEGEERGGSCEGAICESSSGDGTCRRRLESKPQHLCCTRFKMSSLRQSQIQSLLTLLNLNNPVENTATTTTTGTSNGGSSNHLSSSSAPPSRPNSSASQRQIPSSGAATPNSTTDEPQLVIPNGPPVWKLLILDKVSQKILSTSLKVQDLRDAGVTLHL